jgi:hypothetical protein
LRQLLARPASPSSLRRYSLPAGRQGVLRGAPQPPRLRSFFARAIFWELRSHIIPQTESAKMVEIGRFQAQNFRFHHFFGSRQAKRKNETKTFPAETAGFSFPAQ